MTSMAPERAFRAVLRGGRRRLRHMHWPHRGCARAFEDQSLELRQAARNTGPNGAKRDFENISDFLIRIILQIKKAERRLVWFLDLREKLVHAGCVKRIDHVWRDGG